MRGDLPSGTVTFLFTDVEGSTLLLEEVGVDRYAGLLAEHHRLLREVWLAHSGVEVDTAGDAFFVAFARASDALAAAAAAQEALGSGPLSVRMGLHTGEVSVNETGYVGLEVHRAARIAAAGHGGQVLVGSSTAALVGLDGLRDLGDHRFKDLAARERVFQLGEDGFPPLKSLYRTNLPVPATPFLGRERELGEVVGLLERDDVRLLTLTGPGGTGKTRLALQVAAEVSDSYPDGVFWVPLAPLRDPSLLLPTVAQALGVKEERDSSRVEDLARALGGRRLLVFVDNVEHLLPDAADALDAFVAACPTVTTVVTTRERLQLAGERVYAVPPMNESDGEELFRSRAAAVGVELEPSEEVRTLCARLDNLPLALELAAARTVVFSPAQLLDRLAQRLDLLRAGRGVDARQETLRATIVWSHDLLKPSEQTLFRRMSMFAGGCNYDSAEQIADADPDTLQSLLDKSLLRRRDGRFGPRYWMLETIREFAAEQLADAGEAQDLQRRHLEHFAAVAEACYDETLLGNDDLDRFEEEHENLRLALDDALRTDPGLALDLARMLEPWWLQGGETREGRVRLSAALAGAPDAATHSRAWALRAAAVLASYRSDLEVADGLAYEALGLFRELDDQRGAGAALNLLGWNAFVRGDNGEARRLFDEAMDAHSSPSDIQLRRQDMGLLTIVLSAQGEHPRAVILHREVVAGTRLEGSSLQLAIALGNLGLTEAAAGETEQGRRSLKESIALSRQGAHKGILAAALHSLGHLLEASAPAEALAHYRESLGLFREIEDPRGIAYCLEGGATLFAPRGNHVHAVTLLGTAWAIRRQIRVPLTPREQADVEEVEAKCRAALPADTFSSAWEEGAALDATAAADWALQIWEHTE